MKGPDLSKYKRSWGFAIAVILLMGVFFFGYYLYYVPFNRQSIQKDAFLTLDNIGRNFNGRVDDYKLLYRNYLLLPAGGASLTVAQLQKDITAHRLKGLAIPFTFKPNQAIRETDSSEIHLATIDSSRLIFVNPDIPGIAIALPVSALLDNLLSFQKGEFFQSFMVVNQTQGLIYKDDEVGIRSDIQVDSLLSKNLPGFVAGVKDLRMEDEDYKLFYYPCTVEKTDIILCGFLKTRDYDNRLKNMPVRFVYPLVIGFLLLFIFLPVLKFYVMGINEQVRFINLVYFVVSLFAGSTLLTLTIIQLLLLWGADSRAKQELNEISNRIESEFYSEIRTSYHQLQQLDSQFMSRPIDAYANDSSSFSKYLIDYMKDHRNDSGTYFNFNVVQWTDSTGMQRVKGDFKKTHAIFIDVSDRKFFTVYRDKRPYPVPGMPGKGFGMEPVVSRTNGEFIIVISRKSALSGFIAATANRMYSVTDVILPPGYGFSIIDGSGNVLVHSDSKRNLQENFFQKLVSPRDLKEVVASRQEKFFPNIFFYGKNHSLNIRPMDRMPFYLVSFYDKGYIFPVNMRILMFSLIACLFSYFLCVVAWMLLFAKRLYKYHLLYSPMRVFDWAFPKRRLSRFYRHSSYFLIGYIVLLLVLLAISGSLEVSDNGMLVFMATTPLNIVAGLILIHNVTSHHISKGYTHTILPARALRLAFGILVGLSVLHVLFQIYSADYPLFATVFQGLLLLVMIVYRLIFKDRNIQGNGRQEFYYRQYSWLIVLMIICLAVLPACIYTWYPHNQELLQTMKKQQLYLAGKVQERRPRIEAVFRNLPPELRPPAGYVYDRQFKSGIYTGSHEKEVISPEIKVQSPGRLLHENLYFDIADATSNNYYDPQSFPALRDRSYDTAWKWAEVNNRILFRYDMNADPLANQTNALSILSTMPPRYMYVVFSFRGFMLVLILGGILFGMYGLINIICSKIFLRKYVRIILDQGGPQVTCNQALSEEKTNAQMVPLEDSRLFDQAEKQVIDLLRENRRYYQDLWDSCSEKEKYLLFDFAHDGLMNYNNTIEIYSLIEKGILVVNRATDDVTICSRGFRAFILLQKGSSEMRLMHKNYEASSTWQSFRIPFLVILLSIAGFIFFTQEATFQKIAALVTGISTISSLLLKLPFTGKGAEPKA